MGMSQKLNFVLFAFCIILISSLVLTSEAARPDSKTGHNCDLCGPTRLIGCRNGRCYYKCVRRCLGKDNKFYYELLKFNFAGQ